MILHDDQLSVFLEQLQAAPWVALDTEADSLHSYPEKLCLMQFSVPGRDALVDPLAKVNLAPLWPVLQPHEIILHGGDYDLRLLRQCAGFVPRKVFDTMLAARLLGYESFGLGSLVQQHLGLILEKASQKADWSRRPLTPRMEAYARNDSRYLRPLEQILRAELVRHGRLSWHEEICARLVSECSREVVADPDEVWRVKGSFHLSRPALAVLREIWHWREREARAWGRPPFFLLSHDTLLQLAIAAVNGQPTDHFLPRRFYYRHRDALAEAMQRGLAIPPEQHPHHKRRENKRLTHHQRQLVDQLQQRRDRLAAELKLDPSLIASKATLFSLIVDGEPARFELMTWQRKLLFDSE